MWPDWSASTSASVSRILARPTLTTTAPRGSCDSCLAPIERHRLGRQRRRDHQHVGLSQKVSQLIGTVDGIESFDAGVPDATAHRDRPHAEGASPGRNGRADRADADQSKRTALEQPGQPMADELVLRPPRLTLVVEHEGQLFGEGEHHREHVLGDGHGLHTPRVTDQNVAREQLRQAQRFDGDRRGVDPPQPGRPLELVRPQNPRVGDVAIGQPAGSLLVGPGVDEIDVRESARGAFATDSGGICQCGTCCWMEMSTFTGLGLEATLSFFVLRSSFFGRFPIGRRFSPSSRFRRWSSPCRRL